MRWEKENRDSMSTNKNTMLAFRVNLKYIMMSSLGTRQWRWQARRHGEKLEVEDNHFYEQDLFMHAITCYALTRTKYLFLDFLNLFKLLVVLTQYYPQWQSTYNTSHGKMVTYFWSPVTLTSVITDYKYQCQILTAWIIINLKKPSSHGHSYVQLSGANTCTVVLIYQFFILLTHWIAIWPF